MQANKISNEFLPGKTGKGIYERFKGYLKYILFED